MNYKAELRGFALDRAIRMAEIAKCLPEDIFKESEKIVEYLYIPEKDIKSHLETVVPLIAQHGEVAKIDNLILELQQIKAEMEAGIRSPRNDN